MFILANRFLATFIQFILLCENIRIDMLKRFYSILLISLTTIFVTVAAFTLKTTSKEKQWDDLMPNEDQQLVCKSIANLVLNFNYKKVPINDSLSSVIFDAYLKNLDGNKIYFLAQDIKKFERYRTVLDEQILRGDLSGAFDMFNLYMKRYQDCVRYMISRLSVPVDFTQDDTFKFNRENEAWMPSVDEMNRYWNKRVKYDLLNLKLASTDSVKNIETLKKRYENLLSQAEKVNNYDAFQQFMTAFTESVDPHTDYFNPSNAANFNVDMSRSLEGIGASLRLENEFVTVASVVPGGPADKSKQVNIDDKIVAVAQGKDGEFTDIIGWRLDNAIQLIRGAKGTIVRLKTISKGQDIASEPKVIELVREKIILQDQSAKKEIKIIKSGSVEYKIGIISIPAFYVDYKAYQSKDPNYKSTTRDVKLLLDTLRQEGVDAVVVDLRLNGGGSLMEAVSLTGLFITRGPVVQVRDARNRIDVLEDEDQSIAWSGPLAVLVDRFSASASEIFAGAIQDYGRGIVIGTQTYGKGTVQNAIDLDEVVGSSKSTKSVVGKNNTYGQINLTVAKFYRITGSSTQHKGIMPDVSFPMIFPADKYGESSEPSALSWDEIRQSNYKSWADLTTARKELLSIHEKRMKNNSEFNYLLEDIAEFKKSDQEREVTLNEIRLKKEREEEEAQNLQRENERRIKRGLKPLAKGETKPKDEKPYDFILEEGCMIVSDYLRIAKKITP